MFRALKPELGLRPIFHRKQVLAYQAEQTPRKPMKSVNRHDSRATLCRTLATLQRTTTSFRRRDAKTLHLRKTASATPDQAAIYRATGIAPPGRDIAKTIIRTGTGNPEQPRYMVAVPDCRATAFLYPFKINCLSTTMLIMGLGLVMK